MVLKEKRGPCNAGNSFLATSMEGGRSTLVGKDDGGTGEGAMSQNPGKGISGRRSLCSDSFLYP